MSPSFQCFIKPGVVLRTPTKTDDKITNNLKFPKTHIPTYSPTTHLQAWTLGKLYLRQLNSSLNLSQVYTGVLRQLLIFSYIFSIFHLFHLWHHIPFHLEALIFLLSQNQFTLTTLKKRKEKNVHKKTAKRVSKKDMRFWNSDSMPHPD